MTANIKYLGFFILACLLSVKLNAQPDREQKSIRIPAVESPKKKDSALSPLKIEPKNLPNLTPNTANKFENLSEDQKKFILKESDKPFSMFENDGLMDPGQIFVERWRQQAAKNGIILSLIHI